VRRVSDGWRRECHAFIGRRVSSRWLGHADGGKSETCRRGAISMMRV
jgi:hypothetical protein